MEIKTSTFQFPELPEILKPYHDTIFNFFRKPMVLAIPQDELAVLPWQSKIGGYPYLPKGATSPVLTRGQDGEYYHTTMMLLQINFQEISPIPGFPTQGIMQFFATSEPEDCEDGKGDSKLVYYPEVIENIDLIETDFSSLPPKIYIPYAGHQDTPDEGVTIKFVTIDFSLTDSSYSPNSDIKALFDEVDEDLWKVVQDAFAQYLENDLKTSYQAWWKKQPIKKPPRVIQIGGNVYQFFNRDPRVIDDKGVVYDRLLMEYECTDDDTKHGLPLKGYDAVPQFFMNSEDLKALNFSDYFYNCMF
ncbi:MAG: DUF1963 domain-containing protein [Chryseolinea sp.]